MAVEMLEIIDEDDNVIGIAPRKEIHAKGLLHREVNVMFITPQGDIIFQKRSKTKDTFPDLYDAAVGGHVEIGDSYDATAVKEIEEEAGLTVDAADLKLLTTVYSDVADPVTQTRNNVYRAIYGYIYRGELSDLVIEEGAAQGFDAFPAKNMFTMPDNQKKQFISRYIEPEHYADIYDKLMDMVANKV